MAHTPTDPDYAAFLAARAAALARNQAVIERAQTPAAPPPANPVGAPEVPAVIQPERPRSSIKPIQPPPAGADLAAPVDLELARLAAALGYLPTFRAWLAARLADPQGRGILDRAAFLAAQARLTSRRTAQRLLAAGDGLFWRIDRRGRVWLTSWSALAVRLAAQAQAQDARLVAHNRPGGVRAQLDLGGSLQAFAARCYSAWLAAGGRRTISRAALARLWGVNRYTTLRWEKLAGQVTATANYAYSDGSGGAPKHAYLAQSPAGTIVGWRMVNTYTGGRPDRARGGMARKVRAQVNLVLGKPVQYEADGLKRYFYPKTGKRYTSAHQALRRARKRLPYAYALVKTTRAGVGLFEHTDGLPRVDIRRDYAIERTHAFQSAAAYFREANR